MCEVRKVSLALFQDIGHIRSR